MLNSGTFRSDQVHPAGDFTMRDLVNIIPMRDPLVVLKVTGKQNNVFLNHSKYITLIVLGQQILAALENSVSQYPKLEGRFPQVAGVSFAFDPRKPVGSRVDPALVHVGDEYLNLNQYYNLATKHYLHDGNDGFQMFKDAEVQVNISLH